MKRRDFIKQSGTLAATSMVLPNIIIRGKMKPMHGKIGHGSHRYKIVHDWGLLDSAKVPVLDCHEMVQDAKGRLILLTNETKNNIIIYDKSGKLLKTWGSEYPGAHGLTLSKENDEEFLFITDYERHEVIKTTLDGRVLMTLPYPKESGKYESADQYKPTEIAVAPNGDFYVADGYGAQYIIHYNAKGELQNVFGGTGKGEQYFQNAHGICLDDRDKNNPVLLITARVQNAVKRFSLDGKYLETIPLPGAYICRPVVDDENVYFAVLISRTPWDSQTGFVTILDKNNKVISNPGGSDPNYNGDELEKMYQTVKVFKHPHDVCVDDDKNIYIPQWNSGKTYPIKLERI
ncbi:6-bladed beta-propeller [Fulvivirgaceae bacterium BMA10]|uniref:6-bladed beta-propeller n=1 Tax=Splendidivirga corallicola TaxID=3051826 RepID=A0ABT8KXB3_9BACT|nr:6-bladed beta-propeller [Fulvivirgaceae bacterium BMA10]